MSKKRHKDTIQRSSGEKFTFIDLFAGIGGFHIAMSRIGGKCVFASEWDKYAQETYRANFPNTPLYGDITLDETKSHIPDGFDVLCAGFPCQAFSNAGLKKGFEDTRGTLFHEIATILRDKKPKVAFLENVRGLISHDKGKTLQIILQTITEIGYSCNIPQEIIWGDSPRKLQDEAKKMVLLAREFGLCQNRQRIYIILWRNDLNIDKFIYPQPTYAPTKVSDILDPTVDSKYTISDRMWLGHQTRKKRNEEKGKGFGYSLFSPDDPYTSTISARYWKDGSEILIDQSDKGLNPRTLTPVEAGRLQGYRILGNGWERIECANNQNYNDSNPEFKIVVSKKEAYHQFGNSVAIPVIKRIAEEIVKQLM